MSDSIRRPAAVALNEFSPTSIEARVAKMDPGFLASWTRAEPIDRFPFAWRDRIYAEHRGGEHGMRGDDAPEVR